MNTLVKVMGRMSAVQRAWFLEQWGLAGEGSPMMAAPQPSDADDDDEL